MATAFVQRKSDSTGGGATTLPVTFTSSVVAGNAIIVGVQTIGAAVAHSTVADSLGNTYTKVLEASGSGLRLSIWYAKNISGGACTVTFTPSTGGFLDLIIHEYSGVHLTSPLDVFASAFGSSTTPNSGSVTTTVAGELLFGLVGKDTFLGSITPDSPWTVREASPSGRTGSSDQLDKAIASYAASWVIGMSAGWGAAIATFKASADVSITPDAGSLAANGQAPAASQTKLLTPTAGALSLVGRLAFIEGGDVSLEPDTGALSLSGVQAEAVVEVFVTPATGQLLLVGGAPSIGRELHLRLPLPLETIGEDPTELMVLLSVLTPVRAPLIVQFDIEAVVVVLDPLVVTLDIGDMIDAGLGVTFDIIPEDLVSLRTTDDVQAPVARVTIS